MIVETIAPGVRRDFPLQCWTQASIRAAYKSDDKPSAGIYRRPTDPIAAPIGTASAAWYTDNLPGTNTPRQSGYEEGQVVGTILPADSARLMRSITYYLRIFRSIGGDPSQVEEIATVQLEVR